MRAHVDSRLGAAVLVVGLAAAVLTGCGGSDTAATCTPADAATVQGITDALTLYPEIGATLDGQAQQVPAAASFNNGASEYRALIAARLAPSGEVGLWGALYSNVNGAYFGAQPLNPAAVASMPDAAPNDPDVAAAVRDLVESDAARQVIACVK